MSKPPGIVPGVVLKPGVLSNRQAVRDRHVYLATLRGGHGHKEPSRGGFSFSQEKVSMWMFSGNGDTSGSSLNIKGQPRLGTEVIDLNSLVIINEETSFPDPGRDYPSNARPVIISPPYFVATPTENLPVLLTVSTQVTPIAVLPGQLINNYQGDNAIQDDLLIEEYLNVKITVSSWLNGALAGPVAYSWMCIVRVGVLFTAEGI